MSFNEINDELKPYIELSKLTGEVGIQLLEKAPRELQIKYKGISHWMIQVYLLEPLYQVYYAKI